MTTGATPAGWYPDPQNIPGQQRYWDGAAWTDHVSAVASPPPSRPPTVSKGCLVALAIFALLLVLGVAGAIAGIRFLGDKAEETLSDVASDIEEDLLDDVPFDDGTGGALFGDTPCPRFDGSSRRETNFDSPFQRCIEEGVDYVATIETDIGDITIDLLEEDAPATVNNFVALSLHGAYEGVPFHRVVQDFVIQGGDVETQDGRGGPGYEIADELPPPSAYGEGSVAMANAGPNTNGSQFFIVVSDEAAENLVRASGGRAAYSLFGEVLEGMDVVRRIEADGGFGSETPETEHVILSVTIDSR
jgi:cyclophilin family peptidyl-prolyl cis-trans isomerase